MLFKRNNKKVSLILLAVMVVSFAIAGAILVVIGVNNVFTNSNGKAQNINEEKSFAISGVKNLSISTISDDIKIIPSDTDEVKVHFYGSAVSTSSRQAPKLFTEFKGDTLDIRIKYQTKIIIGFNYNFDDLKLDIQVPKKYAENIRVNTTSGNFELDGLSLNELHFNSISGEITASGVSTKDTYLNTTSGEAYLRKFTGELTFHSVSGDVEAEYDQFNNNVQVSTTSGDTKLALPADAEFNINYHSISGKLQSDYPIIAQNSPGNHNTETSVGKSSNNITISSISGDVDIIKNN